LSVEIVARALKSVLDRSTNTMGTGTSTGVGSPATGMGARTIAVAPS